MKTVKIILIVILYFAQCFTINASGSAKDDFRYKTIALRKTSKKNIYTLNCKAFGEIMNAQINISDDDQPRISSEKATQLYEEREITYHDVDDMKITSDSKFATGTKIHVLEVFVDDVYLFDIDFVVDESLTCEMSFGRNFSGKIEHMELDKKMPALKVYRYGVSHMDSGGMIGVFKNNVNSEEKKIVSVISAEKEDVVYDVVEEMPSFPGGSRGLMYYLSNHVEYPLEAMEKDVQGKVIVGFVVEKDGNLGDIHVESSVHPLLDESAVDVVKSMPKWFPGLQGGKPIKVKFFVPIVFRL